MNGHSPIPPRLFPTIGCAGLAMALLFLCLLPLVLVDAMQLALVKLHLSPEAALLTVMGIFIGGLVNIPVHRIEQPDVQVVEVAAVFGLWGWSPRFRRVRRDTIIAINVGGCLIPTTLAVWEVLHILEVGSWPLAATVLVTAANIAVCFRVARPIEGVGIAMPGFVSPLVAVGLTLLLLAPTGADPMTRAPVAFVAGVLGPLVGADLLHLKDITKVSAGVMSIGGAGTFDGIVLSGLLAALLA